MDENQDAISADDLIELLQATMSEYHVTAKPLIAQVKIWREALAFYAEENNYSDSPNCIILGDTGERARKALGIEPQE